MRGLLDINDLQAIVIAALLLLYFIFMICGICCCCKARKGGSSSSSAAPDDDEAEGDVNMEMQDMVEPDMNANDGTGVADFDYEDTNRGKAGGFEAPPEPKGRARRRRHPPGEPGRG